MLKNKTIPKSKNLNTTIEQEKTEPSENNSKGENVFNSSFDEPFLRITALIILVSIIVADYLGYKSQYSNFALGGAVTLYVFGRKGLLLLISKQTGYKLEELTKFLKD